MTSTTRPTAGLLLVAALDARALQEFAVLLLGHALAALLDHRAHLDHLYICYSLRVYALNLGIITAHLIHNVSLFINIRHVIRLINIRHVIRLINQLRQIILVSRCELTVLEFEMSDQLELLATHRCEPIGTQSFLKLA